MKHQAEDNELKRHVDSRKKSTQEDYSRISEIYAGDSAGNCEHFEFVDELIRLLRTRELEDSRIVDLGSGPGRVVDYLFERGFANLVAVDITPQFCEVLHRKYGEEQSVGIVCKDLVEYLRGVEASRAGAYAATFSLIHIPDEEIDEVFRLIRKTLVPGGLFVMSCHEGTFKGMEQEPYQVQKDPRLLEIDRLDCYMNYFTEDELRLRLNTAGLEVVRLERFTQKPQPGGFAAAQIWLLAERAY